MKMQPIFWILIVIVLVVTTVSTYRAYLSNHQAKNASQENIKTTSLSIAQNKFEVEIADNTYLHQKGLMYRENLPANQGMLFIFNKSSIYPFWMKNTLIPLDIIWINEDKKIVYIYENAKPCDSIASAVCNSIIPTATAKYVLELKGGTVEALKIKKDDLVVWSIE